MAVFTGSPTDDERELRRRKKKQKFGLLDAVAFLCRHLLIGGRSSCRTRIRLPYDNNTSVPCRPLFLSIIFFYLWPPRGTQMPAAATVLRPTRRRRARCFQTIVCAGWGVPRRGGAWQTRFFNSKRVVFCCCRFYCCLFFVT